MENNKLIAEFMGMEHCYRPYGDGFMEVKENGSCIELEDLQYHKSWDWLMPVINKIKSIDSTYEVEEIGKFDWEHKEISHYQIDIDLTHKSVVEFIKQYNNTNQ